MPEIYDDWRFQRNHDDVISHFGKTDGRLIENLIWRYAPHRDDVVLDLFAGSGVTLDVCEKWDRRCLLYDRRSRPARGDDIKKHDVLTDELLPELPNWDDISLVFLDPPFWRQAENQYSSDDACDLSHVSLDVFEHTLSDLVNALGDKLSSGSAICLLLRSTQWASGPDHRIRDHGFHVRCNVNVPWEREIICTMGKNATTTMTKWDTR